LDWTRAAAETYARWAGTSPLLLIGHRWEDTMTNINWTKPFFLNPTTGTTSFPAPDPLAGTVVPFPTYGHYGGGHYAENQAYDGTLLTKPDGSPLGYAQLLALGNSDQDPVDKLDYLSYRHDVLTSGPVYSPFPDIDLLNRLILLDSSYDPGASLYDGFATIGMIGSIAAHGYLSSVSPFLLIAGFVDALKDIEFGLENLPQPELGVALNFLFEPTPDPNVFVLDFMLTTTSFSQKLVERAVMKTVDAIWDGGEGDPPLNTGFPLPGTTDYQLVFTVGTHDLDIISV
jgi:hypothetical protein